jgi:hypothetical protein
VRVNWNLLYCGKVEEGGSDKVNDGDGREDQVKESSGTESLTFP